ncbi:HalOD1 output domain-containing protein [Halosimplex aquaticum]|uniref:HalOD1 output domain-containing protein n=1 Tax=Halosimplex aquaticum TaxID=3026162 RepID=A0ABD5Y663_9EURY|nr:HalOD1 output domain-containing protein [Halosimplex aquaticum]
MDGMAVHEARDQVSIDVIETIASVTDMDPLTMEPPLYEAIDTDALDSLYENGAVASVEFEYNGHTIRIDDEQTVTVDGRGA